MKLKAWLRFEKEDLNHRLKHYSRIRILLLLASIFGFLISLFWLWQKTFSLKMQSYDNAIMLFVEQFKSPSLLSLFSWITHLGSHLFIAICFVVLALILIIKRRKRAALVSLLSLGGSAFFISFLKNLFGRDRPFGCLLPDDCLSFPSGHATLAFYFYGLLGYLIFRFMPISLKSFGWVTFGLGALVALIALSRLFLGLHYFSDLLAGFFLGGSWLLLAILLIDLLY